MSRMLNNYLTKNIQEIKVLVSNLVKIKSYSNKEKELAEFIKNYLAKKLNKRISTFKKIKNNILVTIGNKSLNYKKPKILFDAHIDTVPAENLKNWEYNPFEGKILGDKIYGRGSCDDKGAVAALIFTILFLNKLNYNLNPVAFSFSSNEEDSSGKGIEMVLKEVSPEWCVICEPSDLKIVYGHKGKWSIKLTFFGKTAHSSTPHLGQNAIYKAYPLIKKLIESKNKNFKKSPLGEPTYTITLIESKTNSLNSIPHECTLYIDYRSVLCETEKSIKKFILSSIKKEKFKFEVQHKFFPAWILEENHKLLKTALKTYQRTFNKPTTPILWQFCTNGSITMAEHKIPTIGFGPGSPYLAHQDNEYIKISDIYEAIKFYSMLIDEVAISSNAGLE